MNFDEYSAEQAAISAQVARYVATFGLYFQKPALAVTDWMYLLSLLFPVIEKHWTQAATLGRTFYDAQRAKAHPSLAPNDRPLEVLDLPHFVKAMEPARERMSQANSPDNAVGQLALQAVKTVEDSGRRQIIHAVEDDPAPILRGWARVAGDDHPCAWCLMLISRGPVYMGPETAGLDLGEYQAQKMIAAGEDVGQHMKQWHPGCRCRVVPVYKQQSWAGQAAAARALKAWNEAAQEAQRRIDSGEARTKNLNTETRNALRRRLESGTTESAAVAA